MTKPTFIYKYFDQEQYCNEFIFEGKFPFRPLPYFRSCEDISRQDSTEGRNIYGPDNGVKMKMKMKGSEEAIDTSLKLYSSIPRPDTIFCYCTSMIFSKDLFSRFKAKFCVKIDFKKFEYRILKHLKKQFGKEIVYSFNCIEYYDQQNEPETRHADPQKIVFSKPLSFKPESEFRFAFSQNKDVFNIDNIDYVLGDSPTSLSTSAVPDDIFLKLDNMESFCGKLSPKDLC